MGHYVESKDETILREAKRKAYGACPKHKGHMDWEQFWNWVIFGGMILIGSNFVNHDLTKEAYQSSGTMTVSTQGAEETPNVTYKCIDKNTGEGLQSGSINFVNESVTITNPNSWACTFYRQ